MIEALEQLQKRVSEATGPDRLLDLAIANAMLPNRYWSLTHPASFPGNYTTDPEGLGACVALMRSVLPGYTRVVDASAPAALIDVEISPPGLCTGWIKGTHALETHALLLAIISAKLSLSKEKEAV